MNKYNVILIGAIILIIGACKKDPVATCPPQNHFTISNTIKQFAFKKNSYWVLKNSTTGVTDTLKVFLVQALRVL